MSRFRPRPRHNSSAMGAEGPVTLPAVRALAGEVLRPGHFFLAPGLELLSEHRVAEEAVWEVFQGRLLDPAHSRQRRVFEAWDLWLVGPEGRSGEPLLALKLDASGGELHLVRGLESYVWEGYDAGGNVYLSRERRKWVRELVGSLRLGSFTDLGELHDELIGRLFRAVVGTRLPLSSVEAPLPGFTFGELFYCYRAPHPPCGGGGAGQHPFFLPLPPGWGRGPGGGGAEPLRSVSNLVPAALSHELAWVECTRLLEVLVRATPADEIPAAAAEFAARWLALGRSEADLLALLRALFNEVSLSPYTDFAERILILLHAWEGPLPSIGVVDFLGHLLRQLGRHLTAYDLVTFHHRGANYPDALLLEVLLRDYLGRIERTPGLFLDGEADSPEELRGKRLRRRALRQGWLLRKRYEGHPVPDLPTSPGENSRVLPASHPRVPEEQITQPGRRRRRLFPDPLELGPAALRALRASALDLEDEAERRELGAALFLDRPFGGAKAPAEPDSTPLLASVAYSRSVAEERLPALAQAVELGEEFWARVRAGLTLPGLPLERIGGAVRPGTVSLADARRAAADFVFLHSTRAAAQALLERCPPELMARAPDLAILEGRRVLLARSPDGPGLIVYDEALRPRLELEPRLEAGYVSRAGVEWPAAGVQAVRAWAEDGAERDLRGAGIVIV